MLNRIINKSSLGGLYRLQVCSKYINLRFSSSFTLDDNDLLEMSRDSSILSTFAKPEPDDSKALSRLVVDTREPGHIQTPLLRQGAKSHALPAGDFWILDRDSENNNSAVGAVSPLVVIERKTMNDLANALISPRWKSQLSKLIHYKKHYNSHVILIIEGPLNQTIRMNNGSEKLQNLIRSLVLFSPFAIHRTANITESLQSVMYFTKRTSTASFKAPDNASQLLPDKSQSSLPFGTADAPSILQPTDAILTAINGVSVAKARRITGVYPTIKDLVYAFKEQEALSADALSVNKREDPKLWLYKVVDSDNKVLVGARISTTVYNCIMNPDNVEFFRGIWIDMLCKIQRMSPAMALSIAERYPSPRHLVEAYSSVSAKQGSELLVGTSSLSGRKIGATISLKVYEIIYLGKTIDSSEAFPLLKVE